MRGQQIKQVLREEQIKQEIIKPIPPTHCLDFTRLRSMIAIYEEVCSHPHFDKSFDKETVIANIRTCFN